MKKQTRILGFITLVLGALATVGLIYNMFAIQIFKDNVFLDHVIDNPFEFLMLIGFLTLFLFLIMSIVWVSHNSVVNKKSTDFDRLALILGCVCILLFVGVKAMFDEIAREIPLGWETTGEFFVLYVGLFVQLIYSLLIFYHLFRTLSMRNTLNQA